MPNLFAFYEDNIAAVKSVDPLPLRGLPLEEGRVQDSAMAGRGIHKRRLKSVYYLSIAQTKMSDNPV